VDIKKIINGSGLSLIDQGVVSVGNFLSIIICSKIMSANEFGVYVISITIIFMATAMINAFVTHPLRVHGVGIEGDKLIIYVTENLIFLYILAVPMAIVIIILFPLLSEVTMINAVYTAIAFLCFQLQDFSRSVRSIEFNWRGLLNSDLIMHACRLLCLFFLLKLEVLDTKLALLSYSVSTLLAVSATRFLSNIKFVGIKHLNKTIYKAWKFGRWLIGETFVTMLSTHAYVLLVGMYLGTSMAGIFGALQQLMNAINIFHIGLMNYASSLMRKKLNAGDFSGWVRVWKIITFVMFTATILIVLPISIFGEEIVSILYTHEMSAYSNVLYIFSFAVLLAAINVVLISAFRSSNQPQMGLKAKTISAVITLLASYPLVHTWGLYGAAMGIAMTQATWLLMYMYEILVNKRLSYNQVKLCMEVV